MFWDGYRWVPAAAPTTRRPRQITPNPWTSWIATGLMVVLLVGVAIPLSRADATAARLRVTPGEGAAGTRVVAKADGVPARTAVVLLWDGEPIGRARLANRNGKLTFTFNVPNATAGIHQLTLVTTETSRARRGSRTVQLALAPGILLASAAFSLTPPDVPASSLATPPPVVAPTTSSQPTPALTASPTPSATAPPTAAPEIAATPLPTPVPTPVPTVAPTPAPTPPPATSGCTVTFGGDASGGSDVTSALQSFLRGAPAGAVACLAPGGQYRVNGTVHLPGRESGLTIDGNGARWFATQRRNSPILRIDEGGRNIVVRELTLEGYNPNGRTANAHELAWEHGHGLALGGVVNATITDVRILNVNGDGILLDGGWAGPSHRWADGITIRGVLIDGTGRMGVAFTNGVRNAHVSGSTLRNIGMYPFDIEPDGNVFNGLAAGADRITITGNAISKYTIDASWGPYLFAATGFGPESNLEFSNNTVSGQHLRVAVQPNGYLRTNIRILNNRSDTRVSGPAMEFAGCSNVTVTGNVQPLSGGQLASVSGCSNVTISGNSTN